MVSLQHGLQTLDIKAPVWVPRGQAPIIDCNGKIVDPGGISCKVEVDKPTQEGSPSVLIKEHIVSKEVCMDRARWAGRIDCPLHKVTLLGKVFNQERLG